MGPTSVAHMSLAQFLLVVHFLKRPPPLRHDPSTTPTYGSLSLSIVLIWLHLSQVTNDDNMTASMRNPPTHKTVSPSASIQGPFEATMVDAVNTDRPTDNGIHCKLKDRHHTRMQWVAIEHFHSETHPHTLVIRAGRHYGDLLSSEGLRIFEGRLAQQTLSHISTRNLTYSTKQQRKRHTVRLVHLQFLSTVRLLNSKRDEASLLHETLHQTDMGHMLYEDDMNMTPHTMNAKHDDNT